MASNIMDRRVTRSTVDEGAVVGEHVGTEVLEGEIAVCAIGDGAVCVEGIVVVVEGGAVEVDFVDYYVCCVVAGHEGGDGPNV